MSDKRGTCRLRSGGAAWLRGQRGQSLVEVIVGLLVLVPLAAGVMLLGQYIHIEQETEQAARTAAWSATVDPALANDGMPATATEQTLLRERSFAATAAPLRSRGTVPAQLADPLLTTLAGQTLLKPGDVALTIYTQASAPSYLDKIVDGIGQQLSRFGVGNTLPPNRLGLITAQVDARTEPLLGGDGKLLAFMGTTAQERFDFSARTVLLADAWNAAGGGETLDGHAAGGRYARRSVRGVIKPLTPSDWLAPVDGAIRGAADLLGNVPVIDDLITPGLKHFEPGRTAPDTVPVDKLVPYRDAR